tara:strand:+ start:655 stop:1668 length:1014 start_codon:yes stop_codon:yes gene_type:complete
MSSSVPVLSLADYKNADDSIRASFLRKLGAAARDVGFFYLENHGLTQTEQEDIISLSKSFFALSEKEKQQVKMANSPHFRGYNQTHAEVTAGALDFREQFDIMDELPAVNSHLISDEWQKLIGPNQWPDAMPRMRSTLLTWQDRLTEVGLTLLSALCEALEQPADALQPTVQNGPYRHTKLIKYPGSESGGNQGVGAHKDPGYLTFVLQDEHSGLEVEINNAWHSVSPRNGALVVNIGELLELASDGYLKATNHRVVSPPAGVTRYSSAFFMAAQLDADIPVLELPEHLKRLAHGPSSDPKNPLLRQVGENVLKGRKRSHPDVTEKFYSDIPQQLSA